MLLKIEAAVDMATIVAADAPGPFVRLTINGEEYPASAAEALRIANRIAEMAALVKDAA